MTNKPMFSVELRAFLEGVVKLCAVHGPTYNELRALLDNPVVESEFEPDAVCTESDGCPTEGAVLKRFWRENQPDTELCKFYEAEDCQSLVKELVGHVAQLQDAAKRNVKPWEDTFPPTLLPAYIARINAEQPAPVALTVWYGKMPESNGKSNWTAILHRKGEAIWSGAVITIDRSEYPDRVRYEADRMRYMIGELTEEPDILAYDDKLHSGYVKLEHPAPVAVVMPERKQIGRWVDDRSGNGSSEWHDDPDANGYNSALDDVARLNGVKL